jgi:type 2 lantibiotic, mersacidin/lichenicidin family
MRGGNIMKNKVNNWKTPVYEKEEDYDNPAGDIFRELKSDDIDKVMASGTANT